MNSHEAMPETRAYRNASLVLMWLSLAVCGWFALRHIIVATLFPYPLSYPEGVVALWTGRAAAGQSLYPELTSSPPYLHNPYPPLFYWIAAPFHGTANPFLAGRLISLLAMILCGMAVAAFVRKRTGTVPAFAAAALFLCSPVVLRYGCMDKADMVALSCSLLGLLALENSRGGKQDALAGFLCACALLAKPTSFAGLLAGMIYLFSCAPRRRWTFLLTAVAALCVGLGLAWLKSGNSLTTHLVVLNQLPFRLGNLVQVLAPVSAKHAIVFAGLAFFIAKTSRQRGILWWYAVLSVVSTVLAAKIGAEENYLLDLIAAASICSVCAARTSAPTARVLAWCLAAQLLLILPLRPVPVFDRTYGHESPAGATALTPTALDREAGELITSEIKSAQGIILCEDIGYLLLAGKDPLIEPFQFTQLARAGKWDDSQIVGMIERREFQLIALKTDPSTGESMHFTPNMLKAMAASYKVRRHIATFMFLEPKLEAEGSGL